MPHAPPRRLKFAIEFAAIGQQEIEGWLSYFEAMDVNELGAVSSKEVLDYLGFRDSKFMHAAFQLLGEPWDGSRMDFGETVKCIAQFCMRARGVPRRFHFTDTTRGHLTSMRVVSFSSLSCFGPRRGRRGASRVDGVVTRRRRRDACSAQVRQGRAAALRLPDF